MSLKESYSLFASCQEGTCEDIFIHFKKWIFILFKEQKEQRAPPIQRRKMYFSWIMKISSWPRKKRVKKWIPAPPSFPAFQGQCRVKKTMDSHDSSMSGSHFPHISTASMNPTYWFTWYPTTPALLTLTSPHNTLNQSDMLLILLNIIPERFFIEFLRGFPSSIPLFLDMTEVYTLHKFHTFHVSLVVDICIGLVPSHFLTLCSTPRAISTHPSQSSLWVYPKCGSQ